MREQKILEILYHSEQYVSLIALSEKLEVSTRTITTDIKYLIENSERNGFEITLKRKEGYFLTVFNKHKFEQYLNLDNTETQGYFKNRVDNILAILLLENNFVTQDVIADKLQVSKSMIKMEMHKVEKELNETGLKILKKAHYGICIEGSYSHRKEVMITLYEKGNTLLCECVDDVISSNIMQQIEKKFIVLLKEYNLNTNYIELKKIDTFLKINLCMCSRKLQSLTPCKLIDSSYLEIAKRLNLVIQELCNIEMSQVDIFDLSEYLKKKTKSSEVTLVYDDELRHYIDEFLIMSDLEYHTKFNEDYELKQSLIAHVSLLIDRLHQSISFSNPLVNEISGKYPVIFDIAIKFSGMLEEKYHVKSTRDEIGFIATHLATHLEKEKHRKLNNFNHIAIICSSGGGSAFLIKLKMETLFPSSVIRTYSMFNLDEVHKFKPNIIFTIKELNEKFDVPIVLIKELLDDDDIQKIKNMFEYQNFLPSNNKKNDFHTLFKKNTFHIFNKGNYIEMIESMSNDIEKSKYSEKGFTDLVLKREKVLSTIFNNGIAIPHPITMCGNENIISIGIVKQDICCEDKPVKLIFLVCLKKGDLVFHQSITRVLFDVMSDQILISKIRSANSYEDFMKSISQVKF